MAKKQENNQPQEVEITVEYEWDVVISRLKHHRERLDITKKEMRTYIWETYKKSFCDLSDLQVLELGLTLSKTKHKSDIIF